MAKRTIKNLLPLLDTASKRLHIELSAQASADLKQIQASRRWNKKTAVESALSFYRETFCKHTKDGAK
jgi:hypothetical protein